jgi:predicted enzyme related to lactoylglutathione lyase
MATFALTMLVSKDLARSRDFYRDVVGLRLGADMPPHWVDFDLGSGALLGIHPETDELRVQPGSNSNGFAVDDVDAFVAGAEAHGVRVIKEPADESFGRLAVILDPDGYTVQVYTPAARQGHTHECAGVEDAAPQDSPMPTAAQDSPVPA